MTSIEARCDLVNISIDALRNETHARNISIDALRYETHLVNISIDALRNETHTRRIETQLMLNEIAQLKEKLAEGWAKRHADIEAAELLAETERQALIDDLIKDEDAPPKPKKKRNRRAKKKINGNTV